MLPAAPRGVSRGASAIFGPLGVSHFVSREAGEAPTGPRARLLQVSRGFPTYLSEPCSVHVGSSLGIWRIRGLGWAGLGWPGLGWPGLLGRAGHGAGLG